MTNEAYFKSLLGFAPSAEMVEGALTDAGISGTGTYVTGNSAGLKAAAVFALQLLLSTPDTTNGTGETANAIKYDRDAVLKRIGLLQEELKGLSAGPTIKARNVW